MSSTYQNYINIIKSSKELKASSKDFYNLVKILNSFINDGGKINDIINYMIQFDLLYNHLYDLYYNATTDYSNMYGWQVIETYDIQEQSYNLFDEIEKTYNVIKNTLLENKSIYVCYMLKKFMTEIISLSSTIIKFKNNLINYVEKIKNYKQILSSTNIPLIYHNGISLTAQKSLQRVFTKNELNSSIMDEMEISQNKISMKINEYNDTFHKYFMNILDILNNILILFKTYIKNENIYIFQSIEMQYIEIISLISTSRENNTIIDIKHILNFIKNVINKMPKKDMFTDDLIDILKIIGSIPIENINENIKILTF